MNRREFLHPGRIARSAGKVLDLFGRRGDEEEPRLLEFTLVRHARRAMATTFEIMVPFGTPSLAEAAESGLDAVDQLEDQLTVYRDSSEVSRLNRLAFTAPVQVEERLFNLLDSSARLTRATEGAFDISAGALIKAWGFYRRRARVPSAEEQAEVLTRIGMSQVVLNSERWSVGFLRPGLEINLGSIGKGYALDRVAELLRDGWQVPSALLHGGHSSVYALGTEPGNPHGWTVSIRHPWQPERRLAVVRLRDRALGTSAATFQHLEYNGRKLGHILDPRTGWPAEGMASASVVAPTAAEADALATAFYVQGVEWARAYCAAHAGIGAVLLPEGPEAAVVVLGLAPDEYEAG
jgi:thiamine biosynthesis lipoprotein